MRSLSVILVAAAVACATNTAPHTPAPLPLPGTAAEGFTCAMRVLGELEYNILDADRDAGFIRAERQHPGSTPIFMSSDAFFDLMTVTVLEDGEAASLRVHASSQIEEEGQRRSSGIATSDEARTHADTMLARCAGGAGSGG